MDLSGRVIDPGRYCGAMQPHLVTDGRLPIRRPPPETSRDRLRRRLRALGAYTGLRHWLLVRGTPLILGFVALYVANGFVIGWKNTYDVAIGITSPGAKPISVPALAWVLSVVGWLAAPAMVGAVAGTIISITINNRRRRPISEVLAENGDRGE
jgi:hypothetical protein